MNERARERQKPKKREEYGQRRDDYGVDEPLSGPGALSPGFVKVFASKSGNDGCEGELYLVSQRNQQLVPG